MTGRLGKCVVCSRCVDVLFTGVLREHAPTRRGKGRLGICRGTGQRPTT